MGMVEVFSADQFETRGVEVKISSKQTLALSMALHELATNASKYGALSCKDGRVFVSWELQGRTLHLSWTETGGPPVDRPAKKGFGSRLLERLLSAELRGTIKVDYPVSGVQCDVTAEL